MVTTLRITPAEYTVKGVDIIFNNDDGKLIDGASKIYDGKSITFDLKDRSKLSNKIFVTFSVIDKDGKVISTSNKNTCIHAHAHIYSIHTRAKTQWYVSVRTLESKPLK